MRLTEFIHDASKKGPGFYHPAGGIFADLRYNLDFLKIWNSFPGEKYHVIGNHETDGDFKEAGR